MTKPADVTPQNHTEDMCVPCGGGFVNIRVGAIILKDGRFLMVRNGQSDYFYSVGGRIKFGETAEEAVIREVLEETGVRMEIDRLGFIVENYFIIDLLKKLGKECYELAFYFYMKVPENFEPVCRSFTEEDHKEYLEWVSPEEPRTIFPAFFRTELDIRDRNVRHIVYDDRFYLRKMTRSDLEPLHALLSDPETMQYLEKPFTLLQTEAFLETQGLAADPRILAVENKDHAFIGYVIYHDYDEKSKEIGWVLKKEARGQGMAGLLTKQMTAMAAAEGKDAVIECVPAQQVTKKIAEKHGFVRSGTRDGLEVYRRRRPSG
ncbi:MAG: GNAT family N-acetyltransferase [Lachnospiraceae bacterium]|nr:GNAT family N-acetyltransferase [Lachnospiraceae bacterium]